MIDLTQPLVRENEIVFCAGRKGSGKSTLLYNSFVVEAPRTISLDFVGDVKERNANAIEVVGYLPLIQTLSDLTRSGVKEWHIAAVFDQYQMGDLPKLFKLLCPPYNPQQVSLVRSLGGIALECSECDVILPNSGASIEARNMLKRGRHNLLSLFLATQRPQECSRLCTSMADWVISFAMHEPRELKYFGEMSGRYAEVLRRLPLYSSAWYNIATGEVRVIDKDGECTMEMQLHRSGGQLSLDGE